MFADVTSEENEITWGEDMPVRDEYNSLILNKYEIWSKKYAKCMLLESLGQDMKKKKDNFFLLPTSKHTL